MVRKLYVFAVAEFVAVELELLVELKRFLAGERFFELEQRTQLER